MHGRAIKCQRRMPTAFKLWLVILLVTTRGVMADAVERIDLFQAGQGGYKHFRIPGLVVTPGGAVLAYCEARATAAGDWGRTDLLVRRSTDGGRTWAAARTMAVA